MKLSLTFLSTSSIISLGRQEFMYCPKSSFAGFLGEPFDSSSRLALDYLTVSLLELKDLFLRLYLMPVCSVLLLVLALRSI